MAPVKSVRADKGLPTSMASYALLHLEGMKKRGNVDDCCGRPGIDKHKSDPTQELVS